MKREQPNYRSCLEQKLGILKCCKTLAGSYSKGRRLSLRQGIIMMSSFVLQISFLSEILVKDFFILFNDMCNISVCFLDTAAMWKYSCWSVKGIDLSFFITGYSRSIFSGILVRHFWDSAEFAWSCSNMVVKRMPAFSRSCYPESCELLSSFWDGSKII